MITARYSDTMSQATSGKRRGVQEFEQWITWLISLTCPFLYFAVTPEAELRVQIHSRLSLWT